MVFILVLKIMTSKYDPHKRFEIESKLRKHLEIKQTKINLNLNKETKSLSQF